VSVGPRIRFLRRNARQAETLLWNQLRRKRVGKLAFVGNIGLGGSIVDFVCLPARLVAEVGGAPHDLTFEQDERRARWLEGEGFRVIRFWNRDVMNDLESVVRTIEAALPASEREPRSDPRHRVSPSPLPPPARGGGNWPRHNRSRVNAVGLKGKVSHKGAEAQKEGQRAPLRAPRFSFCPFLVKHRLLRGRRLSVPLWLNLGRRGPADRRKSRLEGAGLFL